MPSTLTWLDFSAEEEKRAREVIRFFSQPESRDELGIGVVRDAFSNLFFPGVSVVHTRARYYCFIPWLLREGVRLGRHGERLTVWVTKQERRLIETLRNGGDVNGLIGRVAGQQLKILPSTIYWSSLQDYGVIAWPGSLADVSAAIGSRRLHADDGALTELTDRASSPWDPSLPPAPAGFPNLESLDFTMTSDERAWLRERIKLAHPDTLLAWLAGQPELEVADAAFWQQPWTVALPADMKHLVQHSSTFSLVMHGAALVYNLLLARRCEELGFADRGDPAIFEMELDAWASDMAEAADELEGWSVDEMWHLLGLPVRSLVGGTRRFVDDWVAIALDDPASVLTTPRAASLVSERERSQKKGQARLTNDRLLKQWGGRSGADRLGYRWGQVRLLLSDLGEVSDVRA